MIRKQLDPNLSAQDRRKLAYAASIRLLSSREHSAEELRKKLTQRGFDSDLVESMLQQMIEAGYQCDERFACLYAEQLSNKLYGPLHIRAKLSSRGIGSGQISDAIAALNLSWLDVAVQALQSKFSVSELSDRDELQQQRIARFLNNRGFSTNDSIRALTLARDNVSEIP